MSETSSCTRFYIIEDDHWSPALCPKCKGYLPKHFPTGEQFQCRKCGTVLETLPSHVEDPDIEEDTEYEFGGRLCIVPREAITINTELPPKPRRYHKKATNRWAVGIAFSRRVWKDKDGAFITINGERIPLLDKRIRSIYRDKPGPDPTENP